MSAASRIDAAIDRLDDSLRAAELAAVVPPEAPPPWAELEELVAPHEIPAELRRFWERADPERLPVTTFPRLVGPASAIELNRIDPGVGVPSTPPPTFLVIAYESHAHLSIELDSAWSEGGAIVFWDWSDETFSIAYRSLADLVEVLAEVVSEDFLERRDEYVLVDDQAMTRKARARLDAQGPHPRYGETREIARDVRSWPRHWLEACGIDLRDREPMGATHTIAELVAASADGPVMGRIQGAVVASVGIGGDELVLVDDGTRTLDVWCPAGTSPWGHSKTKRYEFAVTVDSPVGAPPDLHPSGEIQRHALAGEIEAAQAAAAAFATRVAGHRAAATATDIRPLDG